MRRTKQETIDFYRKDFSAGRSDEFILQFNSKDVNKQYAAIMNWKRSLRNQEISDNKEKQYTFSKLMKHLKDAKFTLENLSSISQKDVEKACEIIDIIKDGIENFDRIKKQRVLEDLIKQEEKLQKEGNSLRKKITDLKNELK